MTRVLVRDYRRPGLRRRWWPLAAVAVALVSILAAAWLILRDDGGPDSSLASFLASYEQRDYQGAASLTDGQPDQVAAALKANVEGLDGASLDAEISAVNETGDGEAEASVSMRWQVPKVGEFAYVNDRVRLVSEGDRWLVHWRDSVVHPKLDVRGLRLGTQIEQPDRAPILDRDGRKLVRPRPVVEIGVVPEDLRDREQAIEAIAASSDADASTLAASIRAANPGNFVPAITLRAKDFEAIRSELEPIRGIEFGWRELPLAPTKEFARALLGAVGPVTAEQLKADPGRYEEGQLVGQWGLEAAFDDQLAGKPAREVVIRRSDGSYMETLYRVKGSRGAALHTTLDRDVQLAAEDALADTGGKGALVAVDASSGDILAVANRPVEDTFDRALQGQYPPGSTFKVVTTAALLDSGLRPDETVACPQYATVGGRQFRNFEGKAAGAVPFSVDFAESCNTAFVSLVHRLAPISLREWGFEFGLGRDYELAVPTFGGSVPRMDENVDRAASMIGQGEILASPLSMAGVAATVADGRWRQPRLLASDPEATGTPLPAQSTDILRELMRSVVTSGTGTALASIPGEPIGKSGTAEYGAGDPPPTHAWFIAARDGLAISVLLEDRPSGGSYAAPVAASFFDALAAEADLR